MNEAKSVEELIEIVRRGLRPKYIFFWGHTPKRPHEVDHSCLSNWFPAPFEVSGQRYPTTEHFMMAEKARLFGDEDAREKGLAARSPGKAKAIGRQVRGFVEDTWRSHRFEIVVQGNLAKFEQNEALGRYLSGTGSRVLVEASPKDRVWGIGLSGDDPGARNPRQWKGLNLLGFALMEVRSRILK
jgi:ribA/ribD-fused uncharacterized protein